jgi:anti-sigma B factor antagonist
MIRESTLSELGIKERRVGNVTILDADGRLRIALRFGRSSVTLGDAIVALLANGQRKIVLNLAGVNLIGAKELGDLVSTYVETKRVGGQFKLFNLPPTARQLMLTTKLSSVLDLYESEAQAIESFDHTATLEVGISHI